jgi:uncharacterized protein YecT (DUF1311 family)
MEDCLASALRRGWRVETCVGVVQDPCRETPEGQSTAGTIECLSREHAYWDRLLNQSYRRLRETGDDDRNEALRDVQRQWIAFRAARCAWEAEPFEGGTNAGVVTSLCFGEETARRAIDLTRMLIPNFEAPYRLEDPP